MDLTYCQWIPTHLFVCLFVVFHLPFSLQVASYPFGVAFQQQVSFCNSPPSQGWDVASHSSMGENLLVTRKRAQNSSVHWLKCTLKTKNIGLHSFIPLRILFSHSSVTVGRQGHLSSRILHSSLEEDGKSKCARYWPEGSRRGALTTFASTAHTVTVILIEECAEVDFTRRVFTVLPRDQKDVSN